MRQSTNLWLVQDNGLSPVQRKAVILNDDCLWLIVRLGKNFSEIWMKIQPFLYKKYFWMCRLQDGGHLSRLAGVIAWWDN